MFARLTFISIRSEKKEELRKIYNQEILPVVKTQRGNVGAWLLEPTNHDDDFISLTEWISEADASAYEASGTYGMLVDKVKGLATQKTVLKNYNIAETKMIVSSL